jgi:pimeloyl-ACP methyl ester carboxylesterase
MTTALTTSTVHSADGTAINYRTTGAGAGLIIVPGALSDATDYAELADALAADFTVHTIERRGRGGSGPQGPDYGIETECADLAAVRKATGSRYVFGHSFGGLVALEAARRDADIAKLAL